MAYCVEDVGYQQDVAALQREGQLTVEILVSIAVLVLVGATFYAAKYSLPTYFKRLAEHGFDEQIERLKGEIRESEKRLSAQLDAKQREIDSIRQVAMSGAMNRRIALDARRLQAAERIWSAAIELRALLVVANLAAAANLDEFARAIKLDPNARQFVEALGKGFDPKTMPAATQERPFVSATVWAYFSAYSTILVFGAFLWKALEAGMTDLENTIKKADIEKVIITALPHHEDYIRTHGRAGYPHLLRELEERLLQEIQNMLEGKQADDASLRNAAEIVEAANEIHAQMSKKLGTESAASA